MKEPRCIIGACALVCMWAVGLNAAENGQTVTDSSQDTNQGEPYSKPVPRLGPQPAPRTSPWPPPRIDPRRNDAVRQLLRQTGPSPARGWVANPGNPSSQEATAIAAVPEVSPGVAKQPSERVRTWRASGASVQGKFVSILDGVVVIALDNGGEVEIELAALTDEDQEYVRRLSEKSPFRPRNTPANSKVRHDASNDDRVDFRNSSPQELLRESRRRGLDPHVGADGRLKMRNAPEHAALSEGVFAKHDAVVALLDPTAATRLRLVGSWESTSNEAAPGVPTESSTRLLRFHADGTYEQSHRGKDVLSVGVFAAMGSIHGTWNLAGQWLTCQSKSADNPYGAISASFGMFSDKFKVTTIDEDSMTLELVYGPHCTKPDTMIRRIKFRKAAW